jgi:hypothetical protein
LGLYEKPKLTPPETKNKTGLFYKKNNQCFAKRIASVLDVKHWLFFLQNTGYSFYKIALFYFCFRAGLVWVLHINPN